MGSAHTHVHCAMVLGGCLVAGKIGEKGERKGREGREKKEGLGIDPRARLRLRGTPEYIQLNSKPNAAQMRGVACTKQMRI